MGFATFHTFGTFTTGKGHRWNLRVIRQGLPVTSFGNRAHTTVGRVIASTRENMVFTREDIRFLLLK